MEHILVNKHNEICTVTNILDHLQHGFRSHVACDTQLIQFTHDLVTNMQSGAQTDVMVVDFSKAFGNVSHSKLI